MTTGAPAISPSSVSWGPAGRSAARRHIGELPSQQPPDRWITSGPCRSRRRSTRSSAAVVAVTLGVIGSEEAERLRVVGHQQVLRLAVVVEHHPVVLAADARVLVAAEGRVGG